MKQKFRKLTFVIVDKEMPSMMRHFDSGFVGIIEGTYSQLCGGDDIKPYSLYKIENDKIVNSISWYDESQLTRLPKQDRSKAEKMIEEYTSPNKSDKFDKEQYTIDEACEMLGIKAPSHIKTNPKLSRVNNAQYDIVRQSSHDSTLIFTLELLGSAVENLINKESCSKSDDMEGVTDIEYEIGLISLATVFGTVDLPAGKFPGVKQRVRIPVKCKLIRN